MVNCIITCIVYILLIVLDTRVIFKTYTSRLDTLTVTRIILTTIALFIILAYCIIKFIFIGA